LHPNPFLFSKPDRSIFFYPSPRNSKRIDAIFSRPWKLFFQAALEHFVILSVIFLFFVHVLSANPFFDNSLTGADFYKMMDSKMMGNSTSN